MDPTSSEQLSPSPGPFPADATAGRAAPVAGEGRPAPWRAWLAIPGTVLLFLIGRWAGGIAATMAMWLFAPEGGRYSASGQSAASLWWAAHHSVHVALGLALGNLFVILLALFVGSASTRPLRERLGLQRGRVPARELPWLVLGSIGALGIGVVPLGLLTCVGSRLGALGTQATAGAMASAGLATKVALVLSGSVLVGIAEELAFRGCLQRSLLASWRVGSAITVTAVIFALLHGAPGRIVYVLPISFFLGYVAWRADSILPGMVCHMSVNAIGWTFLAVFGSLLLEARQHAGGMHLRPVEIALTLLAILLVSVPLVWLAVWRVERVVRVGGGGGRLTGAPGTEPAGPGAGHEGLGGVAG